MKKMELKYYVLNYNFNKKRVEPFNIFQNWVLEEETLKEIKKYLRSPKQYGGFENFCEEIRKLIAWQEWSRIQYELSVGEPFPKDFSTFSKIDCYYQAKMNIECLCREIIYQYKEQVKEESKKER